jgi:hypothetical protein
MHRFYRAFSPPFILAFALVGCHLFNRSRDPGEGAVALGPRIGEAAPEIDGEDIEGNRFKLSDYRGKVIVVDFWANW